MLTATSIGKNLSTLRVQNGLSQEELASKLEGYSRQNVSSYETGANFPPLDYIFQLTRLFGCSYETIFEGAGTAGLPNPDDDLFDIIESLAVSEKEKSRLASGVARLHKKISDYDKALRTLRDKVIATLDEGFKRL